MIKTFALSTYTFDLMTNNVLYNKEVFKENGIELSFLKTELVEYKQFKNDFVPYLSIIDVLMFNSKDEIKNMLNRYELV